MKLAPEFVPEAYRELHADLRTFDEGALYAHYGAHGRAEGRTANYLKSRDDFVRQVPEQMTALEIGPFNNPMLVRPTVRYCDVQDQAGLRARAREIGFDPARIPHIDYVLGPRGLGDINDQFDAVISSHSIEHQPDLLLHLREVERLLRNPTARYLALVPDKRYCFDRLIAESTIADVLEAHEAGRTRHTLKSVIEHRALTTHNDSFAHWREAAGATLGPALGVETERVRAAVDEWRAANGGYVDVHAWYFTPDSFADIVRHLHQLKLTRLKLEVLYPTRRNSNEFWAVLGVAD